MLDKRPRIIDVQRKPSKCPDCGERVVDIIYGTGDMTNIELLFEYRLDKIVGGDNIPRRPPIWACSCGCKRFRKVNPDGTDAPVKVKMLKNLRKKPATMINWSSPMVEDALGDNRSKEIQHFYVDIITECDEKERLNITALSKAEAEETVRKIIEKGSLGLKGRSLKCVKVIERIDEGV